MKSTIKRVATGAAAVAIVAGSAFAATAAFTDSVEGETVAVTTGTVDVVNASTPIGAGTTETNAASTHSAFYVQEYFSGNGSLDVDWNMELGLTIADELVDFTTFEVYAFGGTCVFQGNAIKRGNATDLAERAAFSTTLTAAEFLAEGISTDVDFDDAVSKLCVAVRPIIDDADNPAQDKTLEVSQFVTVTDRV